MFKNLSTKEIFSTLQSFFELRDMDIEDIREMGRSCHSEFKEWLTMNEREEMLKECVSRMI